MTARPTWAYDNLLGRPSSLLVQAARLALPGAARVGRQVPAYAEAWRASNVRALAADGPLWVVLGDSMSQGIGASAWDAGWVQRVAARVRVDDRPLRVVNLAVSGARAHDVLERQVPALDALHDRGHEPALVTLLAGANDVGRRSRRALLPDTFARLLAAVPDGTVVAPMPQPLRAAREVNALVEGARLTRRMVVTPLGGGPSSWRGRLAEDHFHPNDRGYEGIAQMFLGVLAEVPGVTVEDHAPG